MVLLDTSALIRFFTKDIESAAKDVRSIIEKEPQIKIPDVVFPELEYVLFGKTYNASRSKILKAFRFLASRRNILLSREVKSAIDLYSKTNLDIADCIVVSSSGGCKLISYDKTFLKTKQKYFKG